MDKPHLTATEYWEIIQAAIVAARGRGNNQIVKTSGGK